MIISFFPLNFFYYFVYYTDTCSSVSVVLLIYASNTLLLSQAKLQTNLKSKEKLLISPQQIAKSIPFSSHLILFILSSCSILCRQTNIIWIMFCIGTTMLFILESCNLYKSSSILSFSSVHSFILSLFQNLFSLLSICISSLLPVIFFLIFIFGFNEGSFVVGKNLFNLFVCLSYY